MLKKNMWLILIVLLACVLRFVKLDYLELFGDEIDAGYQSYSLMTTGKDYKGHFMPLYAQSFSEWRAPMMMYFMIPFIKIFGLNEVGVRSFSAFFGVVSILGFYFLLKKLGANKKVVLLTSFFIAILPWHIQYSRAAFEITLMSSFILWGLYFLILTLEKNKLIYALIAAVLLCLSFYTYNTSNIYVPILALLIIVIYKKVNRSFWVFLGISVLFCVPILWQIIFGSGAERFGKVSIFGDKNIVAEIIEYRNMGGNNLISKIFYNKPVYFAKKIFFNYTNVFSADFLFGNGDVTFRHSLHKVGNLFWVYAIFILVGLISIIKAKKLGVVDKFIIGFLLISPIPSSLTSDGYFHATRLFLMIFPLVYLAGAGIVKIFEYKKIIALFLVAVLMFEFVNFQNYYWRFYRLESWRWWHAGYKELVSKIEKNKNAYAKIYIENTYEPALIRYLFWSKYTVNFDIKDAMTDSGAGNLNGYCIDEKICFVNYMGIVNSEILEENSMYVVSQDKNAGTADWNVNIPANIKIIETVRNPLAKPLFYLVTKETK